MRVLFPAPFSPISEWTSPFFTPKWMWSLASVAPNRLVMPESSRSYSGFIKVTCRIPVAG